MYSTEVKVVTMETESWLERFWKPEKFIPLCKECPEYDKRWSCPSGMPDARSFVGKRKYVELIGVKILYDAKEKEAAEASVEIRERIREASYGAAKKQLLKSLIYLEGFLPDSTTIMAGGCSKCSTCARSEGQSCRFPDQMRLSYSGLGFNLGEIAQVLGMPLLWKTTGLPDYNVAIASLLHN